MKSTELFVISVPLVDWLVDWLDVFVGWWVNGWIDELIELPNDWLISIQCWIEDSCTMMTSSNGNIFCVTDPFWGEFTGRWWRVALMFSSICIRINGWVNNQDASDLRHHCAHYAVTAMQSVRNAMILIPPSLSLTSLTKWLLITNKIIGNKLLQYQRLNHFFKISL